MAPLPSPCGEGLSGVHTSAGMLDWKAGGKYPEITEPDFHFWFFHSSRLPTEKDPDGSNRWRYKNPEMDRLVEAGRSELEPARRKAIYAQAQRLVAEDLPIIPLWHEDNVVLSNVDVQGYTIVPNARLVGLVGTAK